MSRIFGAQCSFAYFDEANPRAFLRWCHRPAAYVRYAADGKTVVDLCCEDHRTIDAVPIPTMAPRAEPTQFFQKERDA